MKLNILIILLITILITPMTLAKEGHIKLLAVSDNGKNVTGSVADLYLEIQPGKGRVFIETFPLTKTDTQITTRFAKEIACKYSDIDCSKYDFFYTLKADTAIIGGPSAGAATTILTVSLLKDLDLDKNTVITGTINSGEIIGVVSGLKQKIQAASEANLTKVLIAKGAEMLKSDNQTTNITKFGNSIGVEVVQVGDVDEALEQFTGIKIRKTDGKIAIDATYSSVMKQLADELCKKTEMLYSETKNYSSTLQDLTKEPKELYNKGRYYSAASICFGNDVRLREHILLRSNLSKAEIAKEALSLLDQINIFNNNISNVSRSTITDLEAYMIVKERLQDAIRSLSEIPSKDANEDLQTLAYTEERLESARLWSKFFGKGGKKYIIDTESLRISCSEKRSEAEERYEYVFSTLPEDVADIKKDIEQAKFHELKGDYELCLFTASKAKARVNTILSSLYTSSDDLNTTIELKISAANKVIARQIDHGLFPMLGYSYYEYAQDLQETDPFLSLFYAEYSLEMSNLDLYFKIKKNGIEPFVSIESIKLVATFTFGLILGGLFIYFWTHRKRR